MGLSPPRGGDRGARVPSRRDRSSHRRAHRDDCVGGLSRDLRRRAARASAAPVPPGLARWSASPSPFVRGVFPRGFAAAADAAEDRPPSDLDATPTPSRASTDDRPDASPTPRVTAPLDRHQTDENDGRDPDRARDREFRATPPASTSSRPPRPPRLVDVRRRALRRDSKLTLDALRVAVVAAADILEPSDVAAFCFQLRDRARLERHRWGAHADDDAALRALARALARVVDALHPENDPRAFVRLLHGVASLASAARGGHGVHPRASLVRGGDGNGDTADADGDTADADTRALRGRRARRRALRRFARWRLARPSSRR